MAELTIQISDRELELLTHLGKALALDGRFPEDAPPSAAAVLEQLLDNIDSGIRRPGSWERPWLCQALGYQWLEAMERDPESSFYERFRLDGPELCSECGDDLDDEDRMKRAPTGAFVGLCCACEDQRQFEADGATAAELRGGRPLPMFGSSSPTKAAIDFMLAPDQGPAALLSAAELERRGVTGQEEHRAHGPNGGEGCFGCIHTQDFRCTGCGRWRCFCRGGGSEPLVTRSFCDGCWDRYNELLTPYRGRLQQLLQARLVAAIPVGFLADATRSLWTMIRHAELGSRTARRRAFSLGRRALKRATPEQLLGLVLLTWPGMWGTFHKRIEKCMVLLRRAEARHGWRSDAVWPELRDFVWYLGDTLTDEKLAKLPRCKALKWLYASIDAQRLELEQVTPVQSLDGQGGGA